MNSSQTPINSFGLPNIVIPAEVLFNDNLTWREKALFGFINNLAYNEKGYCWASNRYLSLCIGSRPDTVSTMLAKLQKEGYIILHYKTINDPISGTKQVRYIVINHDYPEIHAEMLQEAFGKFQNSLWHLPKRGLVNANQPYGKSQNNIESNIESKFNDEALLNKDEKIKMGEIKMDDKLFDIDSTVAPPRVQKVVQLYNKYCTSFPKARGISPTRKTLIEARLKEYPLRTFKEVFQKAEASDFLSRRNGKWEASFVPNIDWLLNKNRMIDILEGKYDNRNNNGNGNNNGNNKLSSSKQPVQTPEEIYQKWGIKHPDIIAYLQRKFHPRIVNLIQERGANSIPDESTLANQIGKLLYDLEEAQTKGTGGDQTRRDLIPSPIGLLDYYLDWLENEGHWVDDIRLNNFSYSNTIFKKFLHFRSKQQNTDQLTGAVVV